MANPDFRRIKAEGYSNYYYEPFYKTIEDQPGGKQVLKLWKEGVDNKLFRPQFHGQRTFTGSCLVI